MIKAVIYCRVSSARQVAEGHGLDSQEKRCRDYADLNGYRVVRIFHDEGESGGLFDRPGMKQLIRFLEDDLSKDSTEQTVVIFDDLKRFARDVEIHFRLKAEICGRNGRIESPNFKFEDSPEGKYVETIMAAGAELERNQNKRQVKQKMKARLELGFWPFCMPPGLKNFKDPDKGKILKPDGSHQAIIRKMAIERFASGELRTQDDVKLFVDGELKKLGIKSNLSHHGIQSLLQNPLNYGMIEYKPWGVSLTRGKHTGLVDSDLYPIVLSKFEDRPKIKIRKDYTNDFPLRGLVRCARCGDSFTGSWSTGRYGKKYPKYNCKKLGCSMRWKTIHRDNVHAQFQELLSGVAPDRGLVDLAIDVLNDVWDQQRASYETRMEEKQIQIRELDTEIESWTNKVAKTKDNELNAYYEQQLKDKLVKRKELDVQKPEMQYSVTELGTATEKVLRTLEDPVSIWQNPDGYIRRTIALMYFDQKLLFDRDTGFGTTTLAGPIALMKELSEQKVPDVEMGAVKPRVKKQPLNTYKLS